MDTAVRQPALFNDRKSDQAAAHVELLETVLGDPARGQSAQGHPFASERTRQAHSLIVKIAEDYALSHTGDYLYVSDLCRVAAVGERTLEYAFKEVMGLTPMTYLLRLRLHRVRPAAPGRQRGDRAQSRPRRSTGASGTLANSRAPTGNASVSCRRILC